MKLTKMYPNWFKSLKKEENSPERHENIYNTAIHASFHNPIHGGDPWGKGNAFGVYTSRQETPTGAIYTYPGGVTSEHKKDMTPVDHIRRAQNHWMTARTELELQAPTPENLTMKNSHKIAASHHFAEAARKAFYNSYGLDHKVSPDEAESWRPSELEPISKERIIFKRPDHDTILEEERGTGSIYHYRGSYRGTDDPIRTYFSHFINQENEPMNLRELYLEHIKTSHIFRQHAEDIYENRLHEDLQKNHDTVLGLLGASRDHKDAADMIKNILTNQTLQDRSSDYRIKSWAQEDNEKMRIEFRNRFNHELPEN